jgi:hypothetical protein
MSESAHPEPGSVPLSKILTGPCEGTFVTDAKLATEALLLKCGEPGVLRKKFLLPWGVILCDMCNAQMEMKALRKESNARHD